jgi:hypothetical protein
MERYCPVLGFSIKRKGLLILRDSIDGIESRKLQLTEGVGCIPPKKETSIIPITS